MNKVCLSIKSLYDGYGENLAYCNISIDDEGYYDLQTLEIGTVCMDGEECEILSDNKGIVILVNNNGECNCQFKLTKEEFETAILK